jgi:hypothetical protein
MVDMSREALIKGLDRCMIPEHMRPGILRWIEEGIKPGHFLYAIITNDLQETYARADDENIIRIHSYIMFFYNHTPVGCWGSKRNAEEWALKFFPRDVSILLEVLDRDDDDELSAGE